MSFSLNLGSIGTALAAVQAGPHSASVEPGPAFTSSGFLLAAAGLCLLPLLSRALLWASPGRRVYFVSWGFAMLLVAAVVAALASLLVGFTVDSRLLDGRGPFLAALAGACLVAWFSAQRTHSHPGQALGLRIEGPRPFLAGLLALGIALPTIVGLAWAWPGVEAWLAGVFGSSAAGLDASAGTRPRELGSAYWLAALLISPALQELLLRGYLQPLLVQNFSEKGGILLSALVFAAMHGGTGFPALFALGFVLAQIKLRTHSTLASGLAHSLYMGCAWAQVSYSWGGPGLPLTF